MTETGGLAIALLAAGSSRRFGDEDKLATDLDGRMLGLHASDALVELPSAHRWVIVSSADHLCANGWREAGFDLAVNPEAAKGMGTSVALAAQLAQDAGAGTLLIALADMPFVTAKHFQALAARVSKDALLASHNGEAPTPPALFGSDHLTALSQLDGDRGAGHLLREAEIVPCPPAQLADIDVPADLPRTS